MDDSFVNKTIANQSGAKLLSRSDPKSGSSVRTSSPPDGRSRRVFKNDDASAHGSRSARLYVNIFITSLILPWSFQIGPLSLSPYRLVLLVMFVPVLTFWCSGRAGKLRPSDLLLFAYCCWSLACLFLNQSRNQSAAQSMTSFGIQFVETMGPFLMARCFIRSADDFLAMSRTLCGIVLLLLPLAVAEAVFNRNVAIEIFSQFLPTTPAVDEGMRMGLRRVQTVFGHPILFGVFCASSVPIAILVLGYQRSILSTLARSLVVIAGTLLSLSSAPIAAMVIQFFLIGWNYALRSFPQRWLLLLGAIMLSYIALEAVSNQGAVGVYITYLTFNAQSGFYRMAIWNYGYDSVLNNPFFGVGLGEWVRASWMTTSIDNFWLLNAIRWGLVGGILLIASVSAALLQVLFARQSDDRASQYKLAYLLVIFVHIFTGWTVHFWGSSYVFFMFMLGSGSWLLDSAASHDNKFKRLGGKGTARSARLAASPTNRLRAGEPQTPQG